MAFFAESLDKLSAKFPNMKSKRQKNEITVHVNEGYVITKNDQPESFSRTARNEWEYTYDEAIDLAGNGVYSLTLLATLSVATLSMGVDIFGFSVVVTGASCELDLGIRETGILLSVTFIGPILMAYPWGYISDTQGRRKSLIISLWTSFIISAASAFSTNWVTLAVLKLISTSFSSCAQSATYTLLGESCTRRFRDVYILIMTSILDFSLAVYVVIAYFILNTDLEYDMGFITMSSWRVLSLVLSMITGLGAIGVLFFYESPKFLLNQNKEKEALQALNGIWMRNGGKSEFPVKKVILNEVGNERLKDAPIWNSLWDQLVPIFKPPLLWNSLQLYFLAAVVYGTNNSYFIWLPYLGEQFVKNFNSNTTSEHRDLCSMIVSINDTNVGNSVDCSSSMDISLVWFSLAQGVSFVLMMAFIARIAHRKRLIIITILLISSLSGIGAVHIEDTTAGFLMLMGVLLNQLIIGVIYSYFVDLYPTSFRGMAACLGTMVARSSALSGVSLLGNMLASHCSDSFYFSSALLLGGVLIAILLPKDKGRASA